MDVISTLMDAVPLLVVTVVGGWLLNGRLSRLERKVDALPTREEFGSLVQRVDRIDSRVDALRSDVTQIALAVGAPTRPQTG